MKREAWQLVGDDGTPHPTAPRYTHERDARERAAGERHLGWRGTVELANDKPLPRRRSK